MPAERHSSIEITAGEVITGLRSLFNPSDPAFGRCSAVLDGHAAGRIFTSHLQEPSWAVLQEAAFGSIYLGGDVQPAILQELFSRLLQQGDVLIGLPQDDPRWVLLPANPHYTGYTLEFTDRDTSEGLPLVPAGCRLRRLDESLFKQILDRNLLIHMYGSVQQALKWGYGLCLLREDELLCESFAGPAADGVIEIGVETNPHHMQRGYALLTCSHLIHEMEKQGYRTYWNCARDNLPSAGLARKLGYRTEKEYRLLAWFKQQ